LSDVFTDNPETDVATQVQEADYNRLSAALFWGRERSVNGYYLQAGLTQFTVDDETVDGASLQAVFTRALSPQSTFAFTVGQELTDTTLTSIEGLTTTGVATEENIDAIVQETSVAVEYRFESTLMTLDASAGLRDSDNQLLFAQNLAAIDPDTEDTTGFFGSLAVFRRFNNSLIGNAEVSFIHEEAVNTALEQDSLLTTLSLSYLLTNTWTIEGGVSYSFDEGIEANTTDTTLGDSPFELEENRVFLSLRWSPPTKATRDSTLELKSLIADPR